MTNDDFKLLYAGTAVEWQDGIRQYIKNLQTWQQYALMLNSDFPVRDLSSLLQDIGEKCDIF